MPEQFARRQPPRTLTLHVVTNTEPLRYLDLSCVLSGDGLVEILFHSTSARSRRPALVRNVHPARCAQAVSSTAKRSDRRRAQALPARRRGTSKTAVLWQKSFPAPDLRFQYTYNPSEARAAISTAGPYIHIVAAGPPTQNPPDPSADAKSERGGKRSSSAAGTAGVGAAPKAQPSFIDGASPIGDASR